MRCLLNRRMGKTFQRLLACLRAILLRIVGASCPALAARAPLAGVAWSPFACIGAFGWFGGRTCSLGLVGVAGSGSSGARRIYAFGHRCLGVRGLAHRQFLARPALRAAWPTARLTRLAFFAVIGPSRRAAVGSGLTAFAAFRAISATATATATAFSSARWAIAARLRS